MSKNIVPISPPDTDSRKGFLYYELQGEDLVEWPYCEHSYLLLICEGELEVHTYEKETVRIEKRQVFLLSHTCSFRLRSCGPSRLLLCRFDDSRHIDLLPAPDPSPHNEYRLPVVPMHMQMYNFARHMICYLEDNVQDRHLQEIKQRELSLILKLFYTRQELDVLFGPVAGGRQSFRVQVWRNYRKVRTVEELAKLVGMSRTNFNLMFKKEFGLPPHQWILRQIAAQVGSHLSTPGASISDAIALFGFNSATHFTRFCKQYLGRTPSSIIAEHKQAVKSV